MLTWTNETRKLGDLIPWPRNPRKIDKDEARRLSESLDEFGQVDIIAVGPSNQVYNGHQRLDVWAQEHGPDYEVAVRVASRELTEKEREKLVVLLHRGAAGEWDFDTLANEFELGDLLEWGFEERELDLGLWQRDVPDDPGPQIDRAEELQAKWQVQRGQVWQIGRHRLMCGDSTSAEDVARLMGGEKASGVFTSPPYAEQRKEQYGGIPADEYVDWWEAIQANVRANLTQDGSFFVNIKPHVEDGERSLYVMNLVVAMRCRWAWAFVEEYCWLRAGVPKMVKYRFKNAFEPVYQFALDVHGFKFRPNDVRHYSDNVPVPAGPGVGNTNWAGKQGHRQRPARDADVQGPGLALFGGDKATPGMAYPSNVLKAFSNDEARAHEASFPPQLPSFFIQAYSDGDDVWFDPFLGSGTVIVAAHQNERRGYGMEIIPSYCAVTLERLQGMGLEPKLI